MRTALVAVVTALVLPLAAAAHVDVRPGLLEAGQEVELRIELPELRPGEPPTGLEVLGPGVRQLSSRADGRRGKETRWRVRIAVDAAPGRTDLTLRASFADGEAVEIRRNATVVPADEDDGLPVAAGAAVVGLLALVAGVVALRRRAPA